MRQGGGAAAAVCHLLPLLWLHGVWVAALLSGPLARRLAVRLCRRPLQLGMPGITCELGASAF